MTHYHADTADLPWPGPADSDCHTPGTLPACPFEAIDADECAMLRERSVAGVSNDVPACPVHGAYPESAR